MSLDGAKVGYQRWFRRLKTRLSDECMCALVNPNDRRSMLPRCKRPPLAPTMDGCYNKAAMSVGGRLPGCGVGFVV